MRNKFYKKMGNVIEVQIRNEYFVSANIIPLNRDGSEFKYALSIHDIESGMSVELGKSTTILSAYKTVNKDVANKLNELIDDGCFDEDVNVVENMLIYLNSLLKSQREEMNKEK